MSETTINLGGSDFSNTIVTDGAGTVVTDGTFDFNAALNVDGTSTRNLFSGEGATLNVNADGHSADDTLSSYLGFANISGSASDLLVDSGVAILKDGGTLVGGQIKGNGTVVIEAGGSDRFSNYTLAPQNDHGISIGDVFTDDAVEYVFAGAVGSLSTATGFGVLTDYGTLVSPLLGSLGLGVVYAGGEVTGGATVAGRGTLDVQSGGIVQGTITIGNGGTVTIPLADIVSPGSALGAELLLTGTSISLSQPTAITLGSTGVLNVGSSTITFSGGAGAVVEQISVAAGIEIEVACFVAGTGIAAIKDGTVYNVPVEQLVIGDVVVTRSGAQRVKWLGRRGYDRRFIAGNHLMLPVCFKAGSIADAVPSRDLFVSPGHAMCVDEMLVPAWRLINGVSVTQAEDVARVSYFHVELQRHDVIFAEGCAVESFFEGAGLHRQAFANAAAFAALYPDEAEAGAMCLPRVEHGFALQAVQARIARRAGVVEEWFEIGAMRGAVDVARLCGGALRVSGWVQDMGALEMPVGIDVLVDGRIVARALANRYRADVRAEGWGSGCCGYEVVLPMAGAGLVEVVRMFDRAALPRKLDGGAAALRA